MNYRISLLFRAIPLSMALFCFCYGLFIFFLTNDTARFTAGPVVFFLGMVCINLYCTAATIIRQLIGKYPLWAHYFFPILAYAIALVTTICGFSMLCLSSHLLFVPGHVVMGLGFICFCVATVVTASTRFSIIPKNSSKPNMKVTTRAGQAFSLNQENWMKAVVLTATLLAWCECIILLSHSFKDAGSFVAGSVVGGIACICTGLIALVHSILNQISGFYNNVQRRFWPGLVLGMGFVAAAWGVITILFNFGKKVDFTGFLLIGLSLICFSISSKVILLAKVWKANYPLAARIPIIPVLTALACLFIAAFLFEYAVVAEKYFVPARVLTAFGAVCFTLYSIVSILESGTKH